MASNGPERNAAVTVRCNQAFRGLHSLSHMSAPRQVEYFYVIIGWMAVNIRSMVLWAVRPCSLVDSS
jgi:hypothetical protein